MGYIDISTDREILKNYEFQNIFQRKSGENKNNINSLKGTFVFTFELRT